MPFGKRRQGDTNNGEVKHPNAKEVRISIMFTRLGEIDTINERFSCEATLFITWRESTDILQRCESQGENSYFWDSNKLWDPQLYIDNAIGDVKEKDVKFRLDKLYDAERREWFFEVHMIKRIQGVFFEKLELYHFPFDVQDLSITLTSHRTQDEIRLVQDYTIPPKMTKSASLDKHIWHMYDHVNIKTHTIKNDLPPSSDYSNEEFEIACSHSALTMQCRVSRKPGYFIINCLVPTLMITLCVFFTFMMDYARFQYRFSLLFTTMLTSITFRWAIHGRVLPTISYMTFLDVYCVSSVIIVFSAMVWHACYLVIYRQDEALAERCDLYAMITFAVIVLIVHIAQTVWFVIAIQKRYYLERLDHKAALEYMKTRMALAGSQAAKAGHNTGGGGGANMPIVSDHPMTSPPLKTNEMKAAGNAATKQPPLSAAAAGGKELMNSTPPKYSSSVKSKRMLYSLSKMEDNSIITVHNSMENVPPMPMSPPPPQHPSSLVRPHETIEDEETSLLIGLPGHNKPPLQQQQVNRAHTPASNPKNNDQLASNLILIGKSSSFSNAPLPGMKAPLPTNHHRDYNNNSFHGGTNGPISPHNHQYSSHSQQQQQQQHQPRHSNHQHQQPPHYNKVKHKGTSGAYHHSEPPAPATPHQLTVNTTHSLEYPYHPLLRQSSRES